MGEAGPKARPVAVAVIDDYAVERAGVVSYFAGSEIEVRAELSSPAEFQQYRPGSFDVAVTDLLFGSGQMSGHKVVERLRHHDPGVRVLAVSGRAMPSVVGDVIGAGALGFLTKDTGRDVFHAAVRTVGLGRPFMTRTLAGQLLSDFDARGAAIADRGSGALLEFLRLCYTDWDGGRPNTLPGMSRAQVDRMLADVWSTWNRLYAACSLRLSEVDLQIIPMFARGDSYFRIARTLQYSQRYIRNRCAAIAAEFTALYGVTMTAGEVARYLYWQRPDIFPRPDPDVREGGGSA